MKAEERLEEGRHFRRLAAENLQGDSREVERRDEGELQEQVSSGTGETPALGPNLLAVKLASLETSFFVPALVDHSFVRSCRLQPDEGRLSPWPGMLAGNPVSYKARWIGPARRRPSLPHPSLGLSIR